MTEPTRPTMPAEPVAPPIVARYHELLGAVRKWHSLSALPDLFPHSKWGSQTPDVRLIGTGSAEEWRGGFGEPREVAYQATDTERLAMLSIYATEVTNAIAEAVQSAHDLANYYAENREAVREYETTHDEWRAECSRLEREYYEALREAQLDKRRALYEVGRYVHPARARNSWQIIARNGRGAIIKELRHDEKPARIRELDDVLEVA